MLFFILHVQSSTGKAWFQSLTAGKLLSSTDAKGPVPMLCLSIPLLVMGSVCAFCLRSMDEQQPHQQHQQQQGQINGNGVLNHRASRCSSENFLRHCTRTYLRKILRTRQRLPLWMHDSRLIQRLRQRILTLLPRLQQQAGDLNMDRTALSYIVLPLSMYALQGIRRLLNDPSTVNKSLPENLGSLANVFGLTAIVAMSILLVPVSRHSPLLKLLSWSPAVAVRLHQWTGRVVIIAGSLHGFMYLYKWKILENLILTDLIIPPASCWNTMHDEEKEATTTSVCYKPLRNLTGAVALLGLLTIAITSLEVARRSCYVVFYTSHLVAGPLVFVSVILHWNRSFLYLGGGLLYYMATTLAVYYECKATLGTNSSSSNDNYKRGDSEGGVRILSVDRIRCVKDSCVSLTIQAHVSAIERFRASQYVNILAPQISMISHPFTINIVPDDYFPNDDVKNVSMHNNTYRMQVIIREMGPFTRQLSSRLMDSSKKLPALSLDGFHGPSDRLQVALEQHDMVVFVAGGIGITPYLTMLQQMHENLAYSYSLEVKTEQQQPLRIGPSKFSLINTSSRFKTKKVMLHWICRDKCLIEYVQRQYFSSLLKLGSTSKCSTMNFRMQIIVHQTSDKSQPGHLGDKGSLLETRIVTRRGISGETRTPFRPSKFAAGSKKTYVANWPLFTSFCLIGWLGIFIVWKCYSTIQDKKQLGSRSVSILVLLCLMPAAAKMINALFTHEWEDRIENSPKEDRSLTRESVSTVNDRVSSNVGTVPTNDGNPTTAPTVVTLEEREGGRPSIRDILSDAFGDEDDHIATNPALYACGPSLLMQSIQSAIRDKQCCRKGTQRRSRMALPARIAYYEESFEM
jgi:predicted ferric reductase